MNHPGGRKGGPRPHRKGYGIGDIQFRGEILKSVIVDENSGVIDSIKDTLYWLNKIKCLVCLVDPTLSFLCNSIFYKQLDEVDRSRETLFQNL